MKRFVDVTEVLTNEEDCSVNPQYYFNPNSDYIDERKEVAIQLLREGYDIFQVAELCALSVRAVRFLQDPSNVVYVKRKKVLDCKSSVPSKDKTQDTETKTDKRSFFGENQKRRMIREILQMVRNATGK
jgi:hypothetical protein